jgi:hypothetical protein
MAVAKRTPKGFPMRLYSAILCLFGLSLLAAVSQAESLSVVDVRRNIPLSDEEPAYKDFYLAGGDLSGLKKNLVVTAVRKIGVRDSKGAMSFGEIEIPVGQLRVLAVYGSVAVAREYKILSRDDHAMLEQTGIMSGDLIDVKGSFVDSKPLAKPKKISELETPSQEGRATASVTAAVLVPAFPAAPVAAATPGVAPAAAAVVASPAEVPTQPAAKAPASTTPVPAPSASNTVPTAVPEAPAVRESSESSSAFPPGLPAELLEGTQASLGEG